MTNDDDNDDTWCRWVLGNLGEFMGQNGFMILSKTISIMIGFFYQNGGWTMIEF